MVKKQRDGFTFYRSFRDSIGFADPSEQLILYKAVADYALDGVEPDITTLGRLGQMCWTSLKPNIRAGFVRFANGCKGGAPVGNQNAKKSTEKQPKINRKTSNTFINENVDVKGKDIEVVGDKVATKRDAFVAPTRDALCAYVEEKGLKYVIPDEFIDHYEANGWRVGKSPMKDWQAAARNWNARHNEFTNNKNTMHHETRPRYEAFDE